MNRSAAPPALVLVDLDGTLVDTLPDIAFSIDGTLRELGLPEAGPERVRGWVGNGTDVLVRRALEDACDGTVDEALYARAVPLFSDLYARNLCVRSRVYDGVIEGLDALRAAGVPLACVTNKAEAFTTRLLTALALDAYFPLVVSGDSLPRRKPDPLPLLHAAEHFAISPADAVLVGDSTNDVKAARAAGFRVVAVSYGYNHGDDIRSSSPDAVIDSLAELPALLARACRSPEPG